MKRYRTIQVVGLFCGKVGLSEKQATPRLHNLKDLGDGVYEIISPVRFKAGEVISVDPPDKATASKLECLDKKPKKPVKKK